MNRLDCGSEKFLSLLEESENLSNTHFMFLPLESADVRKQTWFH